MIVTVTSELRSPHSGWPPGRSLPVTPCHERLSYLTH